MAPAKFDDLSKTAKDLLTQDFASKDISFKQKKSSRLEGWSDLTHAIGLGDKPTAAGATLTTEVNFDFTNAKGATPAKLTWKFPKPLGIAGVAFDKLELDKSGGMKLESAIDKNLHGVADLKIDCKSDLKSVDGVTVGATYTGVAGALIKAECNATNPGKYAAEVSYAVATGATVAVKSTPASMVDVGAQYASGPMFFSAIGKENFAAFSFHGFYKASNELKLAANYDYGGKSNGAHTVGLAYALAPGTTFKGKLDGVNGDKLKVSGAVKHQLAKGVNLTAGTTYALDGKMTWGMAFNIE